MKASINKLLNTFGVELHGTGYLQSLQKSEFKIHPLTVQKELLKQECKIIFDVGANRGDISAEYVKLFPSATIYAFEPFPNSYNHFKERFIQNPHVKSFPVALSSVEGSRELYVNKNVDTNSLLEPVKTGLSSDRQVKNINTIKVETFTVDGFCLRNQIEHIDILKMDIQGAELDVLKGATGLLGSQSIELIYSEVYFIEQYMAQPLFHDISKFLHGFGYYLQDIYQPIYGRGNMAWADVIFVKSKQV